MNLVDSKNVKESHVGYIETPEWILISYRIKAPEKKPAGA